MKKFKYRYLAQPKDIQISSKTFTKYLENLGLDGWEMCGVIQKSSGDYYFFKKEIVDSVNY